MFVVLYAAYKGYVISIIVMRFGSNRELCFNCQIQSISRLQVIKCISGKSNICNREMLFHK